VDQKIALIQKVLDISNFDLGFLKFGLCVNQKPLAISSGWLDTYLGLVLYKSGKSLPTLLATAPNRQDPRVI
jgi:hypothetical protein